MPAGGCQSEYKRGALAKEVTVLTVATKQPERIEIAIGGIGGQGVLFLGRLLLEAAGDNYGYKSGFPNYAGTVRGGSSEYIAILSKREIPSPLIQKISSVILMHTVLFDKYVSIVKPGGRLFINSSVVRKKIPRDDIEIYLIPTVEINAGIGQVLTNLIMVGACLEKEKLLPWLSIERALEERLSGAARQEALRANKEAFRRGVAFISGGKS